MIPHRVVAIANEVAEKVRDTLKSPPYGHPAHVEVAIGRLFAHPAIEYIHVRNSEAGRFIARIEREPAEAALTTK